MKVTPSIICVILALVCFVLAALQFTANGRVSFRDAGYAFLVAGYLTA
jgi:hypothetical protein